MKKKQVRWIDVEDNKTKADKSEEWQDVDKNDIPYFTSTDKITRKANIREDNETDNEYFTGEKNKKLMVHIVQNGIEVTRPLRRRIYDQQVFWRKRTYPIDIKKAIVDSKGLHHLYVSANDMAILSFNKDHEDFCKKCGGKMFIDARNARDLVKRNTIQAIWGIDSTHMILLLIFAVGMMAAIGFAFYSFNQDTLHNTQLKSEQAKNAELVNENAILRNMTRTVINPPVIINDPNDPDTTIRPSEGSSPLPDLDSNNNDNDLDYGDNYNSDGNNNLDYNTDLS